nr:hypothetical protein [Planctomycetota bacterium]
MQEAGTIGAGLIAWLASSVVMELTLAASLGHCAASVRRVILRLLLICCLFTVVAAVEEPVRVDLLVGVSSIAPGTTITVGVRMHIARGWHIPWRDAERPASACMTVDWRLPRGFVVSSLRWPAPSRLVHTDRATVGYVDEVVMLAEISVPYPLSGAGPYRLGAA